MKGKTKASNMTRHSVRIDEGALSICVKHMEGGVSEQALVGERKQEAAIKQPVQSRSQKQRERKLAKLHLIIRVLVIFRSIRWTLEDPDLRPRPEFNSLRALFRKRSMRDEVSFQQVGAKYSTRSKWCQSQDSHFEFRWAVIGTQRLWKKPSLQVTAVVLVFF